MKVPLFLLFCLPCVVKQENIYLFRYKQLAKNGGQWSVNHPPLLALITRVITRIYQRRSQGISAIFASPMLSILGPGGPGTLKVLVNSTFHWTNIYGFSFFLSIKEINWIDGISSSNSSIPEAREDTRWERQLQSNVDGNSVGFFFIIIMTLFILRVFPSMCNFSILHNYLCEYINKSLASLTRSTV